MPTYVYKCKSCKAIREKIKSMRDADEPEYCAERGCKDGEGNPKRMDKQIGQTAFHLKGGGWFKDGYR